MATPKSTKASIKQPTWHSHYDDSEADIVLVSNDGIKFGMSQKALAKSSAVFADMGKLPSPVANQQIGGQLIDLDYDQTTVLHFIQLVLVHDPDLIVPNFDFIACQSLLALSIQFDCGRIEEKVRYQLYGTTYDEDKAWELFTFAAKRDDWKMGRQALRGMSCIQVNELVGTTSTFEEILAKLPSNWRLALASAILSSSIDNRRLSMDWSTQGPKFHRPGSLTDQALALVEESSLCALIQKPAKQPYVRKGNQSQ